MQRSWAAQLQTPWGIALLAAVLIPTTLPLMLLAVPLAALAGLLWLSAFNRAAPAPAPAAAPAPEPAGGDTSEQPASIAAKASTQPPASPSAAAAAAAAAPAPFAPPPPRAPAAAAGAAAAAKGPVGGAAILARLRAQREAKAAADAQARRLTVLYASQTGTAAEIAKTIHAEAQARGVKSQVASMNEFGFDNLGAQATPVVVLVASSTGDGDPPDNAAKFYAAARRRTRAADALQGVTFTVLALGDSNYTRFMAVPRALRTRFGDMGAVQFYDSVEADEVDGLEEVVDAWTAGLWPALLEAMHVPAAAAAGAAAPGPPAPDGLQGVPPLPPCRVRLAWREGGDAAEAAPAAAGDGGGAPTAERPFLAALTGARYLTSESSHPDRQVVHLELDLGGSGIEYGPGDALGVLPCNSEALVDALVGRLGLDPGAVFEVAPAEAEAAPAGAAPPLQHLGWPCTVRAALLRGCDLTSPPRKSLLRLLAEHCAAPAERRRLLELCSREGRQAYASAVLEARPTLVDLLRQFPSAAPPLDALLDALPPLPPRMYSITCSPLEAPGRVQVAFTVVRYPSAAGEREGVATSWLHRLAAPLLAGGGAAAAAAPRVPVFLRKGGDFRPPADLSVPWVLIGPGTGVAPFRGFLQERRARLAAARGGGGGGAAAGECWLYFGCRREDHDFLYRDDLRRFEADGTLTRLEVAFSRAQAGKVYVQHLMAASAAPLRELLVARRGYVFVCGDGAGMAKDVHAALLQILAGPGAGAAAEGEAAQALAEMAQAGRYVRDIWS
jgi:NADPH-ferrihemoprotein reductase